MASSGMWDNYIMDWLTKYYPDRNTKILDIGAGHGKYGRLLSGRLYNNIDAVEIWEAHANALKKSSDYSYVFEEDIRWFDFPCDYDIVIMGDILEHLTVKQGVKLLKKLKKHTREIITVVPYEFPQHELYDNTYEIHLQPDLTPTNFIERYDQHILFSNYNQHNDFKGIGVFVNISPDSSDIIINH